MGMTRGRRRGRRPAGAVLRRVVWLAAGAAMLSAGVAAAQGYDPMRPPQQQVPGAAAPETAPEVDPELGGLPVGPGAEDTFYLCSACHSISLVTQQRLTDERWDYLWTWMIEEQGMPEQDAETRETILDYLKTHFSAER